MHGTPSLNSTPPTSVRQSRNVKGQRGASLIEVMVVMVILLVGIFLVIRIFPTGFGVLQANGNRSQAVRLADQLMSGVDGDAANLPDGVLFGYQIDAGGVPVIRYATDTDPDKLGVLDPTVTDDPGTLVDEREDSPRYNPYFSDINRFRFIKGEGVKIPLPTVSGTSTFASGSVYTVKFGPIFMDATVGDPAQVPGRDPGSRARFDSYLRVYGAPLTAIVRDIDQVPENNAYGFFRTPQVYLIDYGDEGDQASIMFAPRAPAGRANASRAFAVTYSYVAGGQVVTATVTMTVADDTVPRWQPILLPSGTAVDEIVTGSESVSREFDRLTLTGVWDSNDPYQYKLASRNIGGDPDATGAGGVIDNQANMGVLLFNPAGANYTEATASGNRPFTAFLDYMVLDWHIIRENREVPSTILSTNKLVPVRTTLSFIKQVGEAESDGAIYFGLYGGVNSPDIDIFDLSNPTGAALVAGNYRAFIQRGVGADSDYFIDDDDRGGTYRTGTIYLNRDRLAPGTKLRILYKAQGDWGVAFQKAYSRYRAILDPTDGTGYARFPLKNDFDTVGFNRLEPTGAQLRFPFQDFNKAFVVTIQYQTRSGQVKRLPPIQVSADGDGRQSEDLTKYDVRYAFVELGRYLPYADREAFAGRGADPVVSWLPVEINGVSVKTRVVWRDNDSVTDPWRVQDIDSYLTQPKR